MKPLRTPKSKGEVLTLLLPIVIGLLYAGTGGWTAERWNAALAIMGISGVSAAYQKGYWTENAELHRQKRDPVTGRFLPHDAEEP